MRILKGIAVSPGVAIGETLIVDRERFHVARRYVKRDVVDQELGRLDQAMEQVAGEITRHRETAQVQLGAQSAGIFSAHLEMIRDPALRTELEELVRGKLFSPEHAVSHVFRRYARVFQQIDSYLANDMFDLGHSVLRSLMGGHQRTGLGHLASPVILMAQNLTPSETVRLDAERVKAFVTEAGGAGGHTAIVARGLNIPAVVGTGPFLTELSAGEQVVVDGDRGEVILQPDDSTLGRYRDQIERHASRIAQLRLDFEQREARTADGERIELLTNIEFPREVEECVRVGADGVGLYRTEFLYLGRDEVPTEEDHFEAYRQVTQALEGRPVVIRTLDLGADKVGGAEGGPGERNPFLGLRSIRLSLRNIGLFRVQLRAILKASALGPVRVMFPLVSTLEELRRARTVLADAMEDLEEEGVPFDSELPVGIMVEVPATVMMLDRFLPEVDFISIGTNDLIQYTLAVDRSNTAVADLYQDADPAVLRLLQLALRTASAAGCPVSVCGQMSGNPLYTMLLLGLGLRRLSVPPRAVLEIKRVCSRVNLAECQRVAERAMGMDSAMEIDDYLREQLRQVCPDLLHSPSTV